MLENGWYKPPGSRRIHFYSDDRALCRRTGSRFWPDGTVLWSGPIDRAVLPDDCAECRRKVDVRVEALRAEALLSGEPAPSPVADAVWPEVVEQ